MLIVCQTFAYVFVYYTEDSTKQAYMCILCGHKVHLKCVQLTHLEAYIKCMMLRADRISFPNHAFVI